MKYAVTFTAFGALLIYLGVASLPLGALIIWSGAAFAAVGTSYLVGRATIFGKRADGTMSLLSKSLLLPYLLVTWGVWHLQRRGREDVWNEIRPGLYLGRRPLASELPTDVAVVVDLTSEFPAAPGILDGRRYHVLPTLDGSVPDPAEFRALVERIAAEADPVYVHCAVGHGRSATFVVAVLLQRRVTSKVDDAIEAVRAARPAIGLHPSQRALAARFEHATHVSPPESQNS